MRFSVSRFRFRFNPEIRWRGERRVRRRVPSTRCSWWRGWSLGGRRRRPGWGGPRTWRCWRRWSRSSTRIRQPGIGKYVGLASYSYSGWTKLIGQWLRYTYDNDEIVIGAQRLSTRHVVKRSWVHIPLQKNPLCNDLSKWTNAPNWFYGQSSIEF